MSGFPWFSTLVAGIVVLAKVRMAVMADFKMEVVALESVI
jgi:hypothetical protein